MLSVEMLPDGKTLPTWRSLVCFFQFSGIHVRSRKEEVRSSQVSITKEIPLDLHSQLNYLLFIDTDNKCHYHHSQNIVHWDLYLGGGTFW